MKITPNFSFAIVISPPGRREFRDEQTETSLSVCEQRNAALVRTALKSKEEEEGRDGKMEGSFLEISLSTDHLAGGLSASGLNDG